MRRGHVFYLNLNMWQNPENRVNTQYTSAKWKNQKGMAGIDFKNQGTWLKISDKLLKINILY